VCVCVCVCIYTVQGLLVLESMCQSHIMPDANRCARERERERLY